MTDEDWESGFGKSVAVFLNGHGIPDHDIRGEQVVDSSFLVLFNAHFEDIEFCTPPAEYAQDWVVVVDTADPALEEPGTVAAQGTISVPARSLLVLEKVTA